MISFSMVGRRDSIDYPIFQLYSLVHPRNNSAQAVTHL